jgi:hypothetical protein
MVRRERQGEIRLWQDVTQQAEIGRLRSRMSAGLDWSCQGQRRASYNCLMNRCQ